MIVVSNSKYKINSKPKILNLSDDFLYGDVYDISTAIAKYKKKYKYEYLDTFNQLITSDEETLCYMVSNLTWRSYFVDDPFLSIIYYFIFKDFIAKYDDFQVYVKSRELFEYIKFNHNNQVKVVCRYKFYDFKNYLRPYYYLYKLLISKFKYGLGNVSVTEENTDILLYSYSQDSCFIGKDGWHDIFLGDLYEDIEKEGYSIKRFTPLESFNYESELLSRKKNILYMARFFSLRNFLEVIVDRCSLKKTIKNIKNIYVGGVDFSCLYKNYLLNYEKSNIFSVRYSFYLAFKNMLELVKPKVVIYPYENQPWEKLINKACYKYNILTIAVNHPVICSDMFYLYNDANISEEYLPSCILTNGNIEENVIKSMNKYNDTKLYLIGSKRHVYPDMDIRARVAANKYKVAIVFSGEISEYFDIVTSLNKSGDELSPFFFYLKPPPGVYLDSFLSIFDELQKQIKFKYSLFTDNLHKLFEKVETVVFLNTTVGIEAYIENKICINYSTNYKYCLDLAEGISRGIHYADSGSLPSILVATISCEDNELIDTEDYFKPWDKKKFSEVLTEMYNSPTN